MKKLSKTIMYGYIHIEHELGYSKDVVNQIKVATSENEIAKIMKTARERSFED